ncbi:MAG TPA: hypothetical protein VGF95_14865 [Solirubrobacteraceae bacterium]
MPRKPPDATALLQTSIAAGVDALDECSSDSFDPDSASAKASLDRILAAPPLPAAQTRRTPARKLALAAAPATLIAGGSLAAALSLSDSPNGVAKASVIAHAATALEQPGTITYLKVKYYSAHSPVFCLPMGRPLKEGMQAFSGCLGTLSVAKPEAPKGNNVSANPAKDPLTYSSRSWSSPNGSEERVVYYNGDEAVTNTNASEYETFSPQENLLTTLADADDPGPGAYCGPLIGPPISISDIASPSCYEGLYKRAKAGEQHVKLLGQKTIEGKPAYELRLGFEPQPRSHLRPNLTTLLYLDSRTFTPVRLIREMDNPGSLRGFPTGMSVLSVTELSVRSLPDTPTNADLLHMPAHPGARRVSQTEAHYNAELHRALKGLIRRHVHNARARAKRAPRRTRP